jgi:fructokinase
MVVVFGEVLWDVFETGPDTYERMPGGAPSNLAVVLARVGVRVGIVGAVGKDAFGDALASRLRREGVDTARLVRLPNRTGLAFVRRGPRGEPSFLFYRHETADMSLRPEHVRPMRATFAVCGTSTLVHEPLRAATMRFVRLAKRGGAHLVVDLNVRAHLWTRDRGAMRGRIAELVEPAALIKASTADLAAIGGERFLARHAPAATVIVTAGARGARVHGAHGVVSRLARRARCVDATGAGDAFLAGVLAVLSARRALPGTAAWRDPDVFSDALEVGHMLGAKAVSKVGALTGVTGLGEARRRMKR